MSPKRRVLLAFAGGLAVLLGLVLWNPRGIVSEGLRDNFIAEFTGGLITVLFVDQTLDALEDRTERRSRAEFRRNVLATLDHDLYALWSLLVPTIARDDPVRRHASEARIHHFLAALADAETWTGAPEHHAAAVRARVRDLGEDADRLLVLSESVSEFVLRENLAALRSAARDLDEAWPTTPRSQLPVRFDSGVGNAVRALLVDLPRERAART